MDFRASCLSSHDQVYGARLMCQMVMFTYSCPMVRRRGGTTSMCLSWYSDILIAVTSHTTMPYATDYSHSKDADVYVGCRGEDNGNWKFQSYSGFELRCLDGYIKASGSG